MDELRGLSDDELTQRNISLVQQRDAIKDAQRAITAELDRRDRLRREARQIATLPDEHRAAVLASADPELSELVTALVVETAVPTQTIAPVGVPSGEAVGSPGGPGEVVPVVVPERPRRRLGRRA